MNDDLRERDVPPRRSSPWPWVLLAIVAIPLLAVVVAAVLTLGGVAAAWHAANDLLTGRLVLKTDQPAVVTQMEQLNRLETASFTVEKVITGGIDRGNPLFNALAGDRLIFVAHGQVIAGVDLSRLRDEDVSVSQDGTSVSVRLPAAQILSHSLDNQKSQVYDRSTGVFQSPNPQLETQVRQEADRQIVDAACQDGILDQANANAQTQVRALLSSMRFTQIQFLPPRAGQDTGCEGL